MTFRPSVHGWPFAALPDVEPSILGPSAPLGDGATPGGGLCWAALDRYRRGVRIPRALSAPGPGDPLHAELMRRQVDALSGAWRRVQDWQGRPDGSWRDRLPIRVAGGKDLASSSRAEWPGIRARLDRGEPVLLTLLEEADPYRASRAVRQVLATGWRLDDVRVHVSIYDPARPDVDDLHLGFGPAGDFDARAPGGQRVRGFFAMPYDRTVPPAVRAETFGDRSVIGLNRRVRGRLSPLAGRKRLDLLARDAEGSLLHFRRDQGRSWEGVNVTDRDDLGSHELHSDPAALRSGGRLHVFARSYVGDLLHFQEGRRWNVENRTEQKRAGARFRITGDPVAVQDRWGQMSVLGVDKDGGLVHYRGVPVLGWRAEQVAGDPLAGDPVAARAGNTLHVAGLSPTGNLLHWTWDGRTWSPTHPARTPEAGAPIRGKGRLALHVAASPPGEHGVHVALRADDGRLLALYWTADHGWTVDALADDIVGDPVLTAGPAGVHLFARTAPGGLLHAWRAGEEWQVEDVLATRAGLPPVPESGALAGWGSPDELRVWARSERDLWTLFWRADADWTVERLTDRAGVADRHRPGDDPVVQEGAAGEPHLFFTDGRGTVLHVEPGVWRDPAEAVDATRSTPPRTDEISRRRNAEGRPSPSAAPESEPGQRPEPEPAPVSATEAPSEEPEAELPYLDFEADPTPAAPPVSEAEPVNEAPAVSEAGPVGQAEPAAEAEPALEEKPAAEETPTAEEKPGVEPMDLSLLDSWPPPPPSLRKKRAEKDGGRQESPAREREEA